MQKFSFQCRGSVWMSFWYPEVSWLWRGSHLVRVDMILTGLAGVYVPVERVFYMVRCY